MRKFAIVATALVAVGTLAVTAAQAGSLGRPCTAAPEAQWLSLDTLRARVEAAGYRVRGAALAGKAAEELQTSAGIPSLRGTCW